MSFVTKILTLHPNNNIYHHEQRLRNRVLPLLQKLRNTFNMDEVIINLIGVALIAIAIAPIIYGYNYIKKEKRMESTNKKTGQDTRSLFLDTLTKIGCQYQLGEDDDTRIFFDYQGESFFANIDAESIYVHIWDTHWCQVELSDIDEMSRLRKTINWSNFSTGVTTVYTIDNDTKTMIVHTKSIIPFMSSMPGLEVYLRVELNEFFRAHHIIEVEMHKLREQEQDA